MQPELTMEQMRELNIKPISLKEANELSTPEVLKKVEEILQKRKIAKNIYLRQLKKVEELGLEEYMRDILVKPQMQEYSIMMMFYPD